MTARTFIAKKTPAYMYQFGYVPVAARQRSRYGAGHGSDISFVFNALMHGGERLVRQRLKRKNWQKS